jgi:hypothetical protein
MKNDIELTDIVLSATLKCMGYSLDKIEKHGNKGIFFFSDVDDHVIVNYDLGNLKVEPVAFNSAIRSLTTAVRRIEQ